MLTNRNLKRIRRSERITNLVTRIKKKKILQPYFKEAKGYAVFHNIGKAGFGIGGARGSGEVFEDGEVIGSTTLTQLTFGFQLGAKAFSQIIFFQDKNWSAGKNIPIKGLPVTLIVKNRDDFLKIIYKHLGPLEWDHKDIKRGILNLVNNS